jgi:hypothetical protein
MPGRERITVASSKKVTGRNRTNHAETTKTKQLYLGSVLEVLNITANQKIALENHVTFIIPQPAFFALDFSEELVGIERTTTD